MTTNLSTSRKKSQNEVTSNFRLSSEIFYYNAVEVSKNPWSAQEKRVNYGFERGSKPIGENPLISSWNESLSKSASFFIESLFEIGEVKYIPQQEEKLETTFLRIRDRISALYDLNKIDSPKDVLICIANIWEQLEKTSQLAEAKTRILLGQIEKPELAQVPEWLEEQLGGLEVSEDDLAPAHPLAIESTKKLIQSCFHEIPDSKELEAEVTKSPLGRVLVDWNLGQKILQWIVQAAEIPWPGVKVHVLTLESDKPDSKPDTRIIYNSFDLVEHFREQVRRFQQAAN